MYVHLPIAIRVLSCSEKHRRGLWVILKMSNCCISQGKSWAGWCHSFVASETRKGVQLVRNSDRGRISQAKCFDAYFVLKDLEDL